MQSNRRWRQLADVEWINFKLIPICRMRRKRNIFFFYRSLACSSSDFRQFHFIGPTSWLYYLPACQSNTRFSQPTLYSHLGLFQNKWTSSGLALIWISKPTDLWKKSEIREKSKWAANIISITKHFDPLKPQLFNWKSNSERDDECIMQIRQSFLLPDAVWFASQMECQCDGSVGATHPCGSLHTLECVWNKQKDMNIAIQSDSNPLVRAILRQVHFSSVCGRVRHFIESEPKDVR